MMSIQMNNTRQSKFVKHCAINISLFTAICVYACICKVIHVQACTCNNIIILLTYCLCLTKWRLVFSKTLNNHNDIGRFFLVLFFLRAYILFPRIPTSIGSRYQKGRGGWGHHVNTYICTYTALEHICYNIHTYVNSQKLHTTRIVQLHTHVQFESVMFTVLKKSMELK